MRWIVGLMLLLGVMPAQAQQKTPAVIAIVPSVEIVLISDRVHRFLEKEWIRGEALPAGKQVERGYCLTGRKKYVFMSSGYAQLDLVVTYQVDSIRVPVMWEATVRLSTFACLPTEAVLHTHTPITCIDGKCVHGGADAWECFPSGQDQQALRLSYQMNKGPEWAVVQCDRNAFVLYTYHPKGVIPAVPLNSDSLEN